VVGVAMDTVTVTEPFIRAGKMRLIASAYGKRVPSFPDAPTVAEQGFPNVDFAAWLGVVVPRGTPQARIDRLGDAIGKIAQAQDIEDKLRTLGCIPHSLGPGDFAAFLDKEDARWSKIVEQAHVTVD
jgi:tripartite-type tricarboxylate transporter receptor subunit TctC